MAEEKTKRGKWQWALKAVSAMLALVMFVTIVFPSMAGVIGVIAEDDSALSRIYSLLSGTVENPDSYEDYLELANIAIGRTQYDVALDHLEKARDIVKADEVSDEEKLILSELNLKSASVYVILAQNGPAIEFLNEAILLNPVSEQALLLRAQLSMEAGIYERAIEDISAYLALVPDDVSAQLINAQLMENVGRFDDAIAQYDALCQAEPDNEAHLLNALRCRFLAGYYEEALAAFDEYLLTARQVQSGESGSAYRPIAEFLRSACLMQLQRYPEAADGFILAMEAGYDRASCYEQMVLCYFESGAYDKVVECGTLMIDEELVIQVPDVFYQRIGASLVQLEKFEEAVGMLTESMTINDQLSGNAYYRGVALLSLGKYEEAISDFTRSIEQEFLPQFCYYNRGVCHVQLLDYENAIEDMGMTLSSGSDESLIAAAKDILWQLASYYQSIENAAK